MMMSQRRGRNAAAMKLIAALRGKGVLTTPKGEIAVRYGLDVFDNGGRCTAGGWVTGVGSFATLETGRLRLSDGVQVQVSIDGGDQEGASIEVSEADAPALAAVTSSPLAVRPRMSAAD
jgi:hypothetical protein